MCKPLQICHLELGHNDTLCHNLNAYPNETVQNEVQIFQNDFAIKERARLNLTRRTVNP